MFLFYVLLFIAISFVFPRWIMSEDKICSLYFARLGWNCSLSLFFVICFFFFLCTCDICEMRKKIEKSRLLLFFFVSCFWLMMLISNINEKRGTIISKIAMFCNDKTTIQLFLQCVH